MWGTGDDIAQRYLGGIPNSREEINMKRAVSISLGSSQRDKEVEVELLGEKVQIARIGMDGDMEKAAQKFRELDGEVDAFGVGGADLGLLVDNKWYPLHSVRPMVRYVKKTPLVDGTGLKNTLEYQVGAVLQGELGLYLSEQGRRVLITLGADRWGMTRAFVEGEFECLFGDLMFGLGLPIPIRRVTTVKRLAALMIPIAGRLPFKWIYPTGAEQERRQPKWEAHYAWATVLAGDRHYIVRSMPDRLPGKVIVTNTTTDSDVELFCEAGVKYLVTTTPVLSGRSFGTNMMEAALVAAAGKQRTLTLSELDEILTQLKITPQTQELN